MSVETFQHAVTRRRNWLIAIGAAIAVLALVVALLPIGIRYGLAAWLEGDGERTAAIENVDFNPFTGALLIEGLEVEEPTGRRMEVTRLSVDLEILALARRHIHLRSLELAGATLAVELDRGQGPRLVGLPLAGDLQEEAEPSGWRFGVDALAVKDVAARVHLPEDDATMDIQALKIDRFAQWEADVPSPFDTLVNFAGGSIRIVGKTQPFKASPSVSARLYVEGVELARVNALLPQPGLARLSGKLSANLNTELTLENLERVAVASTGSVSSSGLSAALDADPGRIAVDSGSLRWEGALDLLLPAVGETALDLVGDLNASETVLTFDPGDGTPPSRYSSGAISADILKGELSLGAQRRFEAALESQIAISDFEGTSPRNTMGGEEITWRGHVAISGSEAPRLDLRGEGTFESGPFRLALPGAGLEIRQEKTAWDGRFTYSRGSGSDEPQLVVKASAEAAGTRIDSSELGVLLLDLGALSLEGITADGAENVRIDRVSLRSLEALQSLAPQTGDETVREVATVGTLTAEDVAFVDGSHVDVKGGLVEKADVRLERQADGEWRLLGSVLEALGGKGAGEAGASGSPPPTFAVEAWKVQGGSRLSFIDRSVEPAVKAVVSPVEIRLAGIDSRKPLAPSKIDIAATLGTYAKMNLSGEVKPLAPKFDLDVSGSLKGLELSALQGYARSYLGYDLTRGRLDADVDIRIDDGELDARSKLVISKLRLKPTDAKLARPMTRQLEVPVETALSLLRDSEDVIRLQIPVAGDAANPDFDVSDAINTALGNAMKRAMLATVKLAFPLGGVILTLAEAVGDAHLRFEPVPFTAGSAHLGAAAQSYLEKMAELLKARPGVKITVCGAVTEGDRAVLRDRALGELRAAAGKSRPSGEGDKANPPEAGAPPAAALAERASTLAAIGLPRLARGRSEAVKDHLMQQHGIEEERVFLCAAKATPDKDRTTPRADIYM